MACPYFLPTERTDDSAWVYPSRLPLGGGWNGRCTAPGHENEVPSTEQVRDCCNLGYATACAFRPLQREYDSIRFAIVRETEECVLVCYACEKDHLPASHGTLPYDKLTAQWQRHPDPRIQKMAECYLASYLLRKTTTVVQPAASS